jgi:hypothetical protein
MLTTTAQFESLILHCCIGCLQVDSTGDRVCQV